MLPNDEKCVNFASLLGKGGRKVDSFKKEKQS
jgi:hypothetical protein